MFFQHGLLISAEDFSSSTRDHQWDRMKVICRQPFQKYAQFGVSLLCVFTEDGDNVRNACAFACHNSNTMYLVSRTPWTLLDYCLDSLLPIVLNYFKSFNSFKQIYKFLLYIYFRVSISKKLQLLPHHHLRQN